jgi:FixJ family two-component response regulator
MSATPHIGIVDDDPAVLKALGRLLRSQKMRTTGFDSAEAFLVDFETVDLDCVILDVSMPGMSGLALQELIHRRRPRLPLLFLTGQGTIPMSVQAMKSGAVDFLTKPVDQAELQTVLGRALAKGIRANREAQEVTQLRAHFGRLSERELEVLRHVIAGKPNKAIAAKLGVSQQTIKVHRMRVTRKTGVNSVAALVRAADRLGIAAID